MRGNWILTNQTRTINALGAKFDPDQVHQFQKSPLGLPKDATRLKSLQLYSIEFPSLDIVTRAVLPI
jgi:hypothetical protein